MRNRIAIWGRDAQEKRVLITIELQAADNVVRIETFPEKLVTDDVFKAFMDQWRKNKEAELPEPDRVIARELSVTESLLPDDLKAEQTDMVVRAQTEWHFHVLSEKLAQSYRAEIAEIEDRIERAEKYSSDLWNQAKNFWQKVQKQLQDKTLMREQGNELRKKSDVVFAKLKEMREAVNAEYKEESEKQVAKFSGMLEDIETRIGQGTHLRKVFDDLRGIQKKFHGAKFTKDDRDRVYKRIDAAFKAVKEKRGMGTKGGADAGAMSRTEARLQGLLKAMDRMRSSIGRDEADLKFENRRIERTDGQLEAQIRQAKILMINSRMASKQTKLDDMEKTKAELEKRLEKEKKRAEKNAKKEAERAAAAAARAKIAAQMATPAEVSEEDRAKLEAAAAAISAGNQRKMGRRGEQAKTAAATKTTTSPLIDNFVAFSQIVTPPTLGDQAYQAVDATLDRVETAAATILQDGGIADQIEDAVEDAVDTVKAVIEVAKQRISGEEE